jgi:hypothetical protein
VGNGLEPAGYDVFENTVSAAVRFIGSRRKVFLLHEIFLSRKHLKLLFETLSVDLS